MHHKIRGSKVYIYLNNKKRNRDDCTVTTGFVPRICLSHQRWVSSIFIWKQLCSMSSGVNMDGAMIKQVNQVFISKASKIEQENYLLCKQQVINR